MKVFRAAFTLVFALAVVAVPMAYAAADNDEAESITITLNRGKMPQSVLHPGRLFTKPATITVNDFVIRDYSGIPIDGFTIQTSSGRTRVPIHSIEEIRQNGWIHRRTKDIKYVENVVKVDMVLTDGTEMATLMNADFGTIEGKTELGEFFLSDPHTVRRLVFNRPARSVSVPDVPKEIKVAKAEPPLDSDGDGVPDDMDKCPDTPKGAPVNSVGCWTIKGVQFDYDKWDIKPQYYDAMDENVRVLKMNPSFKIEVQGHTDSIASEEYNQTLSEKRAESAKAYFVSKGIAAKRISTRGFGELRPIATNDTADGRAENRRIEIKIISR